MKNETKYSWIPYKKPFRKRHAKPLSHRKSFAGLIITKSKKITLPYAFCLQNNIKSYRYAVFYFGRTTPAVGIEFTRSKQPGCALISWNKQTEAASLSCGTFFSAYGLNMLESAGRYSYSVSQTEAGRPLYLITLAERG